MQGLIFWGALRFAANFLVHAVATVCRLDYTNDSKKHIGYEIRNSVINFQQKSEMLPPKLSFNFNRNLKIYLRNKVKKYFEFFFLSIAVEAKLVIFSFE